MAGSWPAARAAIKAQLDGATISDPQSETLSCYEYPPPGASSAYPWSYVIPSERTVTRRPGGQRWTVIDARVRVVLAPPTQGASREQLAKRYDAWCGALSDAMDDGIALDGNADVFLEQRFSGLLQFEGMDHDQWGFEMTLGEIRISETKAFGA